MARKADMSETALSDLELGYSKRSTSLHRLADALGVNAIWLETGRGPRFKATEAEDQWATITRWRQPLAAGDGSQPDEYSETDGLKFKLSSLRRKGLRPEKLAVLYASGDSMSPRIQNGDALLLDLSDTALIDDRICAIQYDGQLYVKRLRNYGQQWFLVSDNTHDPKWRDPIAVDFNRDFEVVGRVRWIGSWEG